MKGGWLLSFALLNDRIIVILFNSIKFGFIKTNLKRFNGYSIVIGLFRLEMQINLSLVENIKLEFKDYQRGDA